MQQTALEQAEKWHKTTVDTMVTPTRHADVLHKSRVVLIILSDVQMPEQKCVKRSQQRKIQSNSGHMQRQKGNWGGNTGVFHNARSVIIAKLKPKSNQTRETYNYNTDTGSDSNLMPIRINKTLLLYRNIAKLNMSTDQNNVLCTYNNPCIPQMGICSHNN